METDATNPFGNLLREKLFESLTAPIPVGTRRGLYGAVHLPGKISAVVGIRRAGKTMFVHQLRSERLAEGMARERLPYINFEDEQLAGLTAEHLHALVEAGRLFPKARKILLTLTMDDMPRETPTDVSAQPAYVWMLMG